MAFDVCLIIIAFICMMGSCGLSIAAWYHQDLRAEDIAQSLMSMICFGVISWICILG